VIILIRLYRENNKDPKVKKEKDRFPSTFSLTLSRDKLDDKLDKLSNILIIKKVQGFRFPPVL